MSELKKIKRITVVGAGYVGMSIASSLARRHKILILENNKERIERINSGKPSMDDFEIEEFFSEHNLSINATKDKEEAYKEADFIIICVPTNFDNEASSFDTSILDMVVDDAIKNNSNALIIIKSTIPVGYSSKCREKYQTKNIIFSPEFLREHSAIHDVLNPSRIIVGNESNASNDFIEIQSLNSSTMSLVSDPLPIRNEDEGVAIEIGSLESGTYSLSYSISQQGDPWYLSGTSGEYTIKIIND